VFLQCLCCCLQDCNATIPNSVNVNGKCVCGNETFNLGAYAAHSLTACLNSTAVALQGCPTGFPIAVRNGTDAPVTEKCITTDSACPAGYLVLYNGIPAVRQECRLNQGGCIFSGFSLAVTTANNSVIGCANATNNDCPFTAFRSYPQGGSNVWALDKCQAVVNCPSWNSTNSQYTVAVYSEVTQTKPSLCLMLNPSSQACPDVTGLSFPIEVTSAEPSSSPTCGGSTQCTTSRTVQCMPRTATACPSNYTLEVYQNPGGDVSKTPELVECRAPRSSCDLTAAGMTAASPNAATYNIAVRTGATFDGCISAGSTACPPGYPLSAFGSAGELLGCR
jgi:hypothetical protein